MIGLLKNKFHSAICLTVFLLETEADVIVSVFHLSGTSSGGKDVLDFQDVGRTNMKIITGLSLRNGETYYVSVKGMVLLVFTLGTASSLI